MWTGVNTTMPSITVTRVDKFAYAYGNKITVLGDGLYAAKGVVIRCDGGDSEYYYCEYKPIEVDKISISYGGLEYDWFEA